MPTYRLPRIRTPLSTDAEPCTRKLPSQSSSMSVPHGDICRDFVWGICSKGAQCRYRHELSFEAMRSILHFCHDYQNKSVCARPGCTYLHTSNEEENLFLSTGKIPKILLKRYAAMQGNSTSNVYFNKIIAQGALPILPVMGAPVPPLVQPGPLPTLLASPPPTATITTAQNTPPIFTGPAPVATSIPIQAADQPTLALTLFDASQPPPAIPVVTTAPKSSVKRPANDLCEAGQTKIRKAEELKVEKGSCEKCDHRVLRLHVYQKQEQKLASEKEEAVCMYQKTLRAFENCRLLLKSTVTPQLFTLLDDFIQGNGASLQKLFIKNAMELAQKVTDADPQTSSFSNNHNNVTMPSFLEPTQNVAGKPQGILIENGLSPINQNTPKVVTNGYSNTRVRILKLISMSVASRVTSIRAHKSAAHVQSNTALHSPQNVRTSTQQQPESSRDSPRNVRTSTQQQPESSRDSPRNVRTSTQQQPESSRDSPENVRTSTQQQPESSRDSPQNVRTSTHQQPESSRDSPQNVRTSTHQQPESSRDSPQNVRTSTQQQPESSRDSPQNVRTSTHQQPESSRGSPQNVRTSTQQQPESSRDSPQNVRTSTQQQPESSRDSPQNVRTSTHQQPESSRDSPQNVRTSTQQQPESSRDSPQNVRTSTHQQPETHLQQASSRESPQNVRERNKGSASAAPPAQPVAPPVRALGATPPQGVSPQLQIQPALSPQGVPQPMALAQHRMQLQNGHVMLPPQAMHPQRGAHPQNVPPVGVPPSIYLPYHGSVPPPPHWPYYPQLPINSMNMMQHVQAGSPQHSDIKPVMTLLQNGFKDGLPRDLLRCKGDDTRYYYSRVLL